MNSSLLKIEALEISAGQRIDLALGPGEIHCISGPSGIGKTRLLRAIADLDQANGGVSLDGRNREASGPASWRRQLMLVPAQPRWWLGSAAEHCCGDMEKIATQLRLSADRLHAPIDQLSSGEQARAALLRALSCEPRVLLLDEPTGALDARSARVVEELLCDWVRHRSGDNAADRSASAESMPDAAPNSSARGGRGIIWISHDPAQIQRVASLHWTLSASGLQSE